MKAELRNQLINDAAELCRGLPRLYMADDGGLFTSGTNGQMAPISRVEIMTAVADTRKRATKLHADLKSVPPRGQGRDA